MQVCGIWTINPLMTNQCHYTSCSSLFWYPSSNVHMAFWLPRNNCFCYIFLVSSVGCNLLFSIVKRYGLPVLDAMKATGLLLNHSSLLPSTLMSINTTQIAISGASGRATENNCKNKTKQKQTIDSDLVSNNSDVSFQYHVNLPLFLQSDPSAIIRVVKCTPSTSSVIPW